MLSQPSPQSFDRASMTNPLAACPLPPLDGPQETDDCENEVAVANYNYGGLFAGSRTRPRPRKKPVLMLAEGEFEKATRDLAKTAVQDFSEGNRSGRVGRLAGLSPVGDNAANSIFDEAPAAPTKAPRARTAPRPAPLGEPDRSPPSHQPEAVQPPMPQAYAPAPEVPEPAPLAAEPAPQRAEPAPLFAERRAEAPAAPGFAHRPIDWNPLEPAPESAAPRFEHKPIDFASMSAPRPPAYRDAPAEPEVRAEAAAPQTCTPEPAAPEPADKAARLRDLLASMDKGASEEPAHREETEARFNDDHGAENLAASDEYEAQAQPAVHEEDAWNESAATGFGEATVTRYDDEFSDDYRASEPAEAPALASEEDWQEPARPSAPTSAMAEAPRHSLRARVQQEETRAAPSFFARLLALFGLR
ncbi:hypothetical protein I5E68_16560 [Novosphingobium sp. YJ-S2-02]|uniref:Uncharacterized protein n=1 Tax=Novosphingobium aureum TaxID=2792964 RepID=A0A931HFT6_9SPHN|nr:hypothetical protein [Novosphingobium aureum]MBH0114561.1 hypothetical protein [Novosphingobium aureum]